MLKRLCVAVLFGGLTTLVAAADPPDAKAIFEKAERLEVFGVDPAVYARWTEGTEDAPSPLATTLAALDEGEGVRRSAVVADGAARAQIVKAVWAGLARPGDPAKCYEPRHALVATWGKHRAVVHLCFACNYAAVFDANTKAGKTVGFGDSGLKALLETQLAAGKDFAKPGKPKISEPLIKRFGINKLAASTRLTLYSVRTDKYRAWGYGRNTDPSPQQTILAALEKGVGVLGKTDITRTWGRDHLTRRLFGGWGSMKRAGCFEPRHALVYDITPEGGKSERVVFLLCFQCRYVVHLGATTKKGRLQGYSDSRDLKGLLNQILSRRGIAVSK